VSAVSNYANEAELLNNWASQKEAELNTPSPDAVNPAASVENPQSKAIEPMKLPNLHPDEMPMKNDMLTPPASPKPEELPQPGLNESMAQANPVQPAGPMNGENPVPPPADMANLTPPASPSMGPNKPDVQPMPGEKIYPEAMGNPSPGISPSPAPEMNPMPAPPDAASQQPQMPGEQTPPNSPELSPQDAQKQANLAQQQFLQDLSNSPQQPATGNPIMPQSPGGGMSKMGPVPYEALNQVLTQADAGYRWQALQEINKAGMAPPDTYNLLCQTAMPDSPLMNPDISLDTQSQLRQAAFSTLGTLDNKQDGNIPAIALMKDPKTGRGIKDPKTGQQAYQMLPGLQEAGRVLHDSEEDPGVQASALSFLQKIIQAHPSERPALMSIIKGYKTRDANVQALARQIQSGKVATIEEPQPGNLLNAASSQAAASGAPQEQAPQQQQPAFKGKLQYIA
jgi:hypothetical protein